MFLIEKMEVFNDSEGTGNDSRSDIAYIGAGVGVLVVLLIVAVIIFCKSRRRYFVGPK